MNSAMSRIEKLNKALNSTVNLKKQLVEILEDTPERFSIPPCIFKYLRGIEEVLNLEVDLLRDKSRVNK